MNFTEYIRHIVQLRGYSFAYGDVREINRVLTTMDFSQSKNGIVAFAHLITEEENDDHARATLAVYFCHLCPFDFNANDTGECQGYLRNAANTMFADISAGNIARTSNMRYSYGYDDYAENVLWVCARFTIEALQCGCNEFIFRDEIVKNIEYVRTLENGDYEYKITFTDGSTQIFASPRGPKGDDGKPGPPGPPGTTDYNELQNKPTKLSDFENDSDFITSAYNDATKQDTITDLATIRSGAAAGATAVQPADMPIRIGNYNDVIGVDPTKYILRMMWDGDAYFFIPFYESGWLYGNDEGGWHIGYSGDVTENMTYKEFYTLIDDAHDDIATKQYVDVLFNSITHAEDYEY